MKKMTYLAGIMAAAMALTACGAQATTEDTQAAVETGAATTEAATEAVPTETQSTEAGVVEEKTTFTVGFDQNFPPFGYVGDDGNFTGFDIDMATECAKRMGKEIVLQPIDWDAKDMELEAGTIDCIWNGFTMNGREDAYTWSNPYMDNSQVVVVKKESGITDLAGLAGKVVEVQKESAAETALNDADHAELLGSLAQLIPVGEYNTAFMDLEAGAVDAVAIDIGVAKFQIAGKEDQYMILDENISTEQYGIGFLLGNEALRDEVQTTLMDMVADGTFAELSNQYFGYDVCILK